MKLYETVNNAIETYYETFSYYDAEDFFDTIENDVKKLYPDCDVYIYDYDTGNDTYELDRQLDDLLGLVKQKTMIDFCNCWDEQTIITVIVAKKDQK